MGINYADLDAEARRFGIQEVDAGPHYISQRLTQPGRNQWVQLLRQAVEAHNDDWLAEQLLRQQLLNNQEAYVRNGVTHHRNINQPNAAQMLAEGEFNRFYLRGLCLRAENEGIRRVEIYRGKAVSQPRPESEAKIGELVLVDELLAALRRSDFVTIEETAFAIPGGPNSGLTARLRRA